VPNNGAGGRSPVRGTSLDLPGRRSQRPIRPMISESFKNLNAA
jgi:hypothetical protein